MHISDIVLCVKYRGNRFIIKKLICFLVKVNKSDFNLTLVKLKLHKFSYNVPLEIIYKFLFKIFFSKMLCFRVTQLEQLK